MKGRPLDESEFCRLLEAAAKVRPGDTESWRRLLTGLWLSGLRLREAVDLSWNRDAVVSVDQSGPHPVLRFLPQGHKAFRDEHHCEWSEWKICFRPRLAAVVRNALGIQVACPKVATPDAASIDPNHAGILRGA